MHDVSSNYDVSSRGRDPKIYVLFAVMIALLAGNVYLFWRVQRLQKDVAQWRASLITELSYQNEVSSTAATGQEQRLAALREELQAAKRQAATAAGKAKMEALKHAEELAARLAAEQEQQQQQVETELTEMKQAASAANVKIDDVSSEVAVTKSELHQTVSDLKRVTGDMGVMSGYIATNSQELAALKALGERQYFEFNLVKTSQPQRIGGIKLLLKKADAKRNRYTVEVYADDKKVEKKDKNINEPVQFYVAGARQPYEIVVNEVKRDQLVGYLATPKVQMARR